MDLGTPALSVRRCVSWIRKLPRESVTAQAVHGENAAWGLQEQLLAGILDGTHTRIWQAGRGKGKRPKPVPRPGVAGHQRKQIGGGTVMSLAEAREKQRRWAEGRSGKVDRPSQARAE